MHRDRIYAEVLRAAALLCVVACCGCQKTATFPVKGSLIIGGKPAARANLVFHPIDQNVLVRPVAFTESDGSFRLMTHAVDDGAPPGDYVVTIFWRDETIPFDGCSGDGLVKHDLLHGRYFDRTKSTLRATVLPKSNQVTIHAEGPVGPNSFVSSPDPLGRTDADSTGAASE